MKNTCPPLSFGEAIRGVAIENLIREINYCEALLNSPNLMDGPRMDYLVENIQGRLFALRNRLEELLAGERKVA